MDILTRSNREKLNIYIYLNIGKMDSLIQSEIFRILGAPISFSPPVVKEEGITLQIASRYCNAC